MRSQGENKGRGGAAGLDSAQEKGRLAGARTGSGRAGRRRAKAAWRMGEDSVAQARGGAAVSLGKCRD